MTAELIRLGPLQLGLAAALVLALAFTTYRLRLGTGRSLLIAAVRAAVQLSLIGLVLEALFAVRSLHWVALMAVIMLLIAGREVMARQQRRLTGWWGFGIGTLAMFISSFAVTILALTVIIQADPWYQPQYAIPLLGMLLGNTMTGLALCLDRLTGAAWQQRQIIEARLMLGDDWREAMSGITRDAMRSAMIPMINSMAAAGLVSLPGMMTGQILAGSPPLVAVSYQILVFFLITAGTGFAAAVAVQLGARRLFDERHRLRLDRLGKPRH